MRKSVKRVLRAGARRGVPLATRALPPPILRRVPQGVVRHVPAPVMRYVPPRTRVQLGARSAGRSWARSGGAAAASAMTLDYLALMIGSLAEGERGTIAMLTSREPDVQGVPGEQASAGDALAPDVLAACGLGRRLLAHRYGVSVLPAGAGSELPAATIAVLVTSPKVDPSAVPSGIPLLAWAVDDPAGWVAHRGLAAFDLILAGSTLLAERLAAGYSGPIEVLQPAVDADPLAAGRSGEPPAVAPVGVLPQDRRAKRPLPVRGVVVLTDGDGGPLVKALLRVAGRVPVEVLAPAGSLTPALRPFATGPKDPAGRAAALARSLVAVVDSRPAAAAGLLPAAALEALSAGALPIVNTRLGLAEAQLAALPSFRDGGELATQLDALISSPVTAVARARAVGDVVAREHTYAARARRLLDVLDMHRLDRHRQEPAPAPATLAFFPDFRVTNPYQSMLYAALPKRGVRVLPLRQVAERAVPRDGGGRLDSFVLHVHWTSAIIQVAASAFEARARLDHFCREVRELRRRGGLLVWTVHNIWPHEMSYPALEAELCRFLAAESDVIHVLGPETIEVARPHYELDPAKVVVIPHSSYVGIYPDVVPREQARRRLGLLEHEIALLTLGGVRPYRGLDTLLDAFDTLLAGDPRLRLLVAGKPSGHDGVAQWLERCGQHKRVIARFQHLPPAELQVWLRAADIAVLPYRAILNSGAFMLAQSFGLPIVAPREGSLAAALDPAFATGFDPATPGDLAKALYQAIERVTDPDRARAAHAASYAAALSYPPSQMACDFADALAAHLPASAPSVPTAVRA